MALAAKKQGNKQKALRFLRESKQVKQKILKLSNQANIYQTQISNLDNVKMD